MPSTTQVTCVTLAALACTVIGEKPTAETVAPSASATPAAVRTTPDSGLAEASVDDLSERPEISTTTTMVTRPTTSTATPAATLRASRVRHQRPSARFIMEL